MHTVRNQEPVRRALWMCGLLGFALLAPPRAHADSSCVARFLTDATELDWDLNVDSAVAYLKHWATGTCTVYYRNNHFTIGPEVNCQCDTGSVGIGYRWGWGKTSPKEPGLEFYSVHFSKCADCMRAFESLRAIGYVTSRYNGIPEVRELNRKVHQGRNRGYRVEIFEECCPGNRLKLYRSKPAPPDAAPPDTLAKLPRTTPP